jgi:hypothetical protein
MQIRCCILRICEGAPQPFQRHFDSNNFDSGTIENVTFRKWNSEDARPWMKRLAWARTRGHNLFQPPRLENVTFQEPQPLARPRRWHRRSLAPAFTLAMLAEISLLVLQYLCSGQATNQKKDGHSHSPWSWSNFIFVANVRRLRSSRRTRLCKRKFGFL